MFRLVILLSVAVMLMVMFNSKSNEPLQASANHSYIERGSNLYKKIDASFFPRDLKIVALGDSLTSGFGDQSGNTGYITVLEQLLQNQRGVDETSVKNFAIEGHRSDQLLEELERSEVKYSLSKADYILVTIGGNDVMKVAQENIFDLTNEPFSEGNKQYQINLNLIVSKIKEVNSDAQLYFVGIYNPFATMFSAVPEIEHLIESWNQSTENTLSSYDDTYFIPIADVFEGKEEHYLYDDLIHPNQVGYKHMANRILTYISHYDLTATYVIAEIDEEEY
ncbi:SGNH/GDSL hydrolase family protein [Bacillus sp. AK128]